MAEVPCSRIVIESVVPGSLQNSSTNTWTARMSPGPYVLANVPGVSETVVSSTTYNGLNTAIGTVLTAWGQS
jgi:hypothetical protein